jgi:hypothetical protein
MRALGGVAQQIASYSIIKAQLIHNTRAGGGTGVYYQEYHQLEDEPVISVIFGLTYLADFHIFLE